MSKNFDEGLAVGFLLGKKQGGSGPCPPPEIKPPFSHEFYLAKTDKTLDATANSDYSSFYTIEPD